MKKSALLIIVVLLCFTNCQKNDINVDLCYSNTLISQINSGDLAVHGLTYNSNCLVYESTEPFAYKRFSYDSNNTLKKVEEAYSFSAFSCVMVPGIPLESDPRKASINAYSEFEYDNALMLTKKSFYYMTNGHFKLISWQSYDYSDGNIVRVSMYNP